MKINVTNVYITTDIVNIAGSLLVMLAKFNRSNICFVYVTRRIKEDKCDIIPYLVYLHYSAKIIFISFMVSVSDGRLHNSIFD